MVGIFLAISAISFQQAYSTGLPTEFIREHIENARNAIMQNNTEVALEELQLAEDAMGVVPAEE